MGRTLPHVRKEQCKDSSYRTKQRKHDHNLLSLDLEPHIFSQAYHAFPSGDAVDLYCLRKYCLRFSVSQLNFTLLHYGTCFLSISTATRSLDVSLSVARCSTTCSVFFKQDINIRSRVLLSIIQLKSGLSSLSISKSRWWLLVKVPLVVLEIFWVFYLYV